MIWKALDMQLVMLLIQQIGGLEEFCLQVIVDLFNMG